MKSDSEQQQLKALFLEQRSHDGRVTPAFDRIWRAAAARGRDADTRSVPIFRLVPTAVALFLLGVAIVWLVHFQHGQSTPPSGAGWNAGGEDAEVFDVPWESQVLISEWQSPTDFLLNPSEDRLAMTFQPWDGHGMNNPSFQSEHHN